ncbi:MAG TPA: histidine ammonia-lyase [Gemmatimonadaceae bacterium]|nr:histidine ammonia-lyase [Gemmatimonadaceae bacterium]
MPNEVVIDGNSLRIEDVIAVARHYAPVALSKAARERAGAARRTIDRLVAEGAVVYGVTTGFGKLSDVAIPPEKLADLQRNLVRSHAAGVGDLLPEAEVRAMMLLRANVIAKGHSGARPEIAELLADMLNARVYPPVPEQGSVGASGDLAPLAHLALSLIGEGDLHRGADVGPAARMLDEAGLSPVTLQPKEGLALINGTQAHTAVAALALVEAHTLWRVANIAGAMSLEALKGTPTAFDARIHDARGQLGQAATAAALRELLADSEIRESHRHDDRRVQDAYCLRCMPQVHGPVLDAVDFAAGIIGRELNAATDNPLIFDEELLSGGNFHGQSVAMALDFLAIAVTNLAVIAERRVDRLTNPDMNEGLPAFLTSDPGVNSGMMMAQVSAAALTSECKILAHPASVDSIPTGASKEDVVPMAMAAAYKLRRIVRNVRRVLAIELMCAAQGIDFRAPLRPGRGVARAHGAVRRRVKTLMEDRVLSTDIEALARAIEDNEFTPEMTQ